MGWVGVGAAEGCDLLILIFGVLEGDKDQKIAAFGSSYKAAIFFNAAKLLRLLIAINHFLRRPKCIDRRRNAGIHRAMQ